MTDEAEVPLPPALALRLERMLETVSLASIGDFDAALARLTTEHHDVVGLLEEGLRIFIDELRAAHAAHAQAMTALQRANAEIEQKLALIETQRATLRELSSPVLDVWQDVLAVPLVGRIDDAGMLDVIDKLLHRVVATRARWIFVDLTGIETVDATTADQLVRLAGSITLVGAQCLFTGISPGAAETLANHGVGAETLRSLPNLRDALRLALATRPR